MGNPASGLPNARRAAGERELDVLPSFASPMLHRLLDFWTEAGGMANVPDRSHLDAMTLRPWLGHISVYEALPGTGDFRIRLEGTSIVALTGEDWTGKQAGDVDRRFGSNLVGFMRRVIETGRPAIHRMRVFQNEVEYITRLLLPIRSRPGGAVDQVFLVIYPDPLDAAAEDVSARGSA